MLESKVVPDEKTYNSLINAAAQAGNLDRAETTAALFFHYLFAQLCYFRGRLDEALALQSHVVSETHADTML